jgi:hypothetical protein
MDPHNFENLDPDTDPEQSGKLDPDLEPHQSEKVEGSFWSIEGSKSGEKK